MACIFEKLHNQVDKIVFSKFVHLNTLSAIVCTMNFSKIATSKIENDRFRSKGNDTRIKTQQDIFKKG